MDNAQPNSQLSEKAAPDATNPPDEPHLNGAVKQDVESKKEESNAEESKNEKSQKQDSKKQDSKKDSKKDDSKKDDSKKDDSKKDDGGEEKQPPGGFDDTPIPRRKPGYTVKITFHRATNLPMADYTTFSSDPYVLAEITTGLPTRHEEDPPLQHRTKTIRRCTDPVWESEWIVGNIPATGFHLKCRVKDEDPSDHDDRLGNAHITVPRLSEGWSGIHDQGFKIKKKSGSKRAYFVRIFATCIRVTKHLNGELFVSVELVGPTESSHGGRAYTIGPIWYTKHYSPMLGRLAGQKDDQDGGLEVSGPKKKNKASKYDFQANQIQLHGPVPEALYHRFVEFKPWVALMFTTKGVRGWLLSHALHHQHNRVYNFSSTTEYGTIGYEPSEESTKKFLDLVHYDKGGRIFTYVMTLDGLFRFTETGKEFGIDMLSKHTMHSDVAIYIAFSGEFFIRRLKHKSSPPPPDPVDDEQTQHPPDQVEDGKPVEEESSEDPALYELVIDNDSGTYRPNADLLPQLKEFLARNFPGLHILTLDCNADKDRQQRMKQEQRDRKKKEGGGVIYRQASSSSLSSSNMSDFGNLDETDRPEPGVAKMVRRSVKARGNQRKQHWKTVAKGRGEPVEGNQHDVPGEKKSQAPGPAGAAADSKAHTSEKASANAGPDSTVNTFEKGDASANANTATA